MKKLVNLCGIAMVIATAVACNRNVENNNIQNVNTEQIASASENQEALFDDAYGEVAKRLRKEGVKYSAEYERQAENGDFAAIANLADMYAYGIDVQPDRRKAYRFYSLLMQNGDVQAKAIVGYMTLYGFGPEEDTEKGLHLMVEAANEQSGLAFYFLGMFYAHNLPANDNIVAQAKIYFTEASKLGIAAAEDELNTLNNKN